jgi:amino acid transporter
MAVLDWLLGKPLATHREHEQQIGPAAGVPVLGLDALSSAAYGPEAALTLLLPLGVLGLAYVVPITAIILTILLIVYFSYKQTIAAYPNGGGSYTVAKENLGPRFGLLAGAALAVDYILNVAVGISAGVGALVSAVPSLLPHTLALCLGILVLLTLVNLRGLRESGLAFMLPTYGFVCSLAIVILIGLGKTLLHGFHPIAVTAPPQLPANLIPVPVTLWLLLRAFASGCTAMTGVEAVSNAVPVFRQPAVPLAQRTLTIIIGVLAVLLGGIAYLARVYGINATAPGTPGYQSMLSMLAGAVIGRGWFYYTTMATVVAVLCLSANTSFAGFPRLCRIMADDRYLPGAFAVRGRRLVYSKGIILLAVLAGLLLVVFGGITDRLIPLFAIGAFLAFTLSQAGMVIHWRREGGKEARHSMPINAAGAVATGVTLVVVAVSKFAEGAWVTVLVVPLLVLFFLRVNRHYARVAEWIATVDPLERPDQQSPICVVAAGSWNKLTQHGLKFALRLSHDVHVVRVKTELEGDDDLADNWDLLIRAPARAAHIPPPRLVTLKSDYREFFKPFVDYILRLERGNPGHDIVVVVPDLVMSHWYEGILHNNRGTFLRTILRLRAGPRVIVVNAPFHMEDFQAREAPRRAAGTG